jgi:hypothetical protein
MAGQHLSSTYPLLNTATVHSTNNGNRSSSNNDDDTNNENAPWLAWYLIQGQA